jgi:NADPH:quinone reductase-like Zn-dependent oxidoreductase
MGFEESSTVSLCGLTAAQAIYYRLGLEAPFRWKQEVGSDSGQQDDNRSRQKINFFIFGASTSVAMYAAQLVRHSAEVTGATITLFGTASESRFQMLRNQPYCYDHLVDYHDTSWPDKIGELSGDVGMDYILDCISEGDSVTKVSQTLREGGHLAIVRSKEGGAWKAENLPVEPVYGAVWEGLGVEIQYSGLTVPKSPEARAFAVEFYKWLSEGGKLKPNPVRVMPGGLERIVEDSFTLLGSGSMQDRDQRRKEAWMRPVSAEKLVMN